MICRTSCLVENLMIVIDEEHRESLRDQVMCYLIRHAAKQLSHDILDRVYYAINYGRVHVGTHVVNKLLVCSILFNDWRMFYAGAALYASEPSVELFGVLSRASVSHSIYGRF